MKSTKELSKILELSVAQRLLIMGQIWDSIVDNPDSIPLTAAQQHELDRRLKSYYESPNIGHSWESVKKELLSTP